VAFTERGGVGHMEMTVTGEPLGLGPHGNEYWVASILLQARRLSGQTCTPERAWFAHPEPTDRDALARVLATTRRRFATARTGPAAPPRGSRPCLDTAAPLLLGLPDGYAPSIRGERHAGEDAFVARVRQAIVEHLPQGAPTIDDAARSCGVSGRTLQRRLGE